VEHVVRYTGVSRSFLIVMSRTYSGSCVLPIDQTGILISIVMQVCASFRDQPAIPFYVSGIQLEHSPERRNLPQATHRGA
jgi:hypothetical protein